MGKRKLEDFDTDQLRKRRKFGSILVVILIGTVVLNGIVLVVQFVSGKGGDVTDLAPGLACIVIAIPICFGIKNINEELKRRENF